jgi:hypothetical protein
MKKITIKIGILIAAVLILATLVGVQGYYLTNSALVLASSRGIYPTAEAGSIDQIQEWFQGIEKIKIDYAGPAGPNSLNRFFSHVWYVGWTVWAEKDGKGNPIRRALKNYRRGGGFWIQTNEGWIQIPESAYPGFLGFWMRVYGLAGPGQVIPFTELPGVTVFEIE